jgi:hypothetical protein
MPPFAKLTIASRVLLIFLSLTTMGPAVSPGGPAASAPLPPGIHLDKRWKSKMPSGVESAKELGSLLAGFASPSENLGEVPGLNIYGGINYLTPLKTAKSILAGVILENSQSRNWLTCPGFPVSSLMVYQFSPKNPKKGFEENAFDRMFIITDKTEQVVAIELSTENPAKSHAFDENPNWRTYDFVNYRTKGLSTAKVTHNTSVSGNVMVIRSSFIAAPHGLKPLFPELQSPYRFFVQEDGRPTKETKLFLPKPLAALMQTCINAAIDP